MQKLHEEDVLKLQFTLEAMDSNGPWEDEAEVPSTVMNAIRHVCTTHIPPTMAL